MILIGGVWRSIRDAERILNHPGHASQKSHGRGGGDADEPEDDFEDDEGVGGVDEGTFGYGRDPSGESYTEFDVDQETGEPKFSQSYRDQYGPVDFESSGLGGDLAVVITRNKSLHIADDSGGTQNRKVIQEFQSDPKSAEALGNDVWNAATDPGYSGPTNQAGVDVKPRGGGGAEITWKNGSRTELDDEGARDLGDALDDIANWYRKRTK